MTTFAGSDTASAFLALNSLRSFDASINLSMVTSPVIDARINSRAVSSDVMFDMVVLMAFVISMSRLGPV